MSNAHKHYEIIRLRSHKEPLPSEVTLDPQARACALEIADAMVDDGYEEWAFEIVALRLELAALKEASHV